MKLSKSLSDVEAILSKHRTLKDYIDETGEKFILASTLLGILVAPSPVAALAALGAGVGIQSFKFSRLFEWIPEKLNYWNKGKELAVIERYEQATLVNMIVLHLAIKEAVKSITSEYIKFYEIKLLKLDEEKKVNKDIIKEFEKIDEEIKKAEFEVENYDTHKAIEEYTSIIWEPYLTILYTYVSEGKGIKTFIAELKNKLVNKTFITYQSFLVHLSLQFPEFSKWVDLNQQNNIIENQNLILKQLEAQSTLATKHEEYIKIQKEFNRKTTSILKKIVSVKDLNFEESTGFKNLISRNDFFLRKLDRIEELYKKDKLSHIEAHHKGISSFLIENLINDEDLGDIVYPKNEDIYIPQGFKAIYYNRHLHQKKILLDEFWASSNIVKEENVGKFLMNELIDPENSFKPIIILGNPGAGKSMLSKIFAARLLESADFVPFFIRLRDVTLSDTSPNNHINDGIKNTLTGSYSVDWISWAREFPNRISTIVLDGFDELLRATQTEINNYISKIKELQEKAFRDYGIVTRVILTSRLTVMQDVEIPQKTTIIRLDSFDKKRVNTWIEKWNGYQKKNKSFPFAIPDNYSLNELAAEPLILFMLAIYDFDNSALQNSVSEEKYFNQSKLFDKIFEKFTRRQLEKDENYQKLSPQNKYKHQKVFRLRLGVISLLMFLKDLDYKETQRLKEELGAFGLGGEDAQPNLIFKGFFFIHRNKSTEYSGTEAYTFEFVHKSFGEFLAADFMLRVMRERFDEDGLNEYLVKDDTIRFCWSFNWLHKHYNVTKLLFEQVDQVIVPEKKFKQQIITLIKKELKIINGTKINIFPISDINLIESKPVLEHLAIYSQNLILLWVALYKDEDINLNVYQVNDTIKNEFDFEKQDRTEINQNKAFWKKLTKLWELVGNKVAVAKLIEWVEVIEKEDTITLNFKNSKNENNFINCAKIACNDYEKLLGFDARVLSIEEIVEIINRKPEFLNSAIITINNNFNTLYVKDEQSLLGFIKDIKDDVLEKISVKEIIRLSENSHLYFPYLHLPFTFVVNNLYSKSTDYKELFNLSSIPYPLKSEGIIQRSIVKYIMETNLKQFGINRSMLFLEQIIDSNHIDSSDFSLFLKLFSYSAQDITVSSFDLYLKYLDILNKLLNQNVGKNEMISIKEIYEVGFNVISKKSIVSYGSYQFASSIILTVILLRQNISLDSTTLNLPDITFLYNYFDKIIISLSEYRKQDKGNYSHSSSFFLKFELLELIVIRLKQKVYTDRIRSLVIAIVQQELSYLPISINNASLHFSTTVYMPKFFDLMNLVLKDESLQYQLNFSFNNILEMYLNALKRIELRKEDFLKLLYQLVLNKNEINEEVIISSFIDFKKTIINKSKDDKRTQLQFAILVNAAGVDIRNTIEYPSELMNTLFSYYPNELFQELSNNFYYEIHSANYISPYLLRRSLLHREKFTRRR